ncbi:MAG: low molecular weight phosphotyrosine protein phosphatase [Rhodobacter sp.]|nr:low molecular weight phosphotyrosine protein phosphatase [Paracoccaceae bacterium]MCC0077681.1 low molecular weight phosphotyrosine protein phosphatase [Rhodobacter sp.]
MRILMLCLGNICRSPTAEAVMRAKAAELGLAVEVDSAGTGGWHVGEPPDRRAQAAARSRGLDISGLRARQLSRADFRSFDLILAMDGTNLSDAARLAPHDGRARLTTFLDEAGLGGDVPDPYYTGQFDAVLDLIEDASIRILDRMA